MKIDAVCSNARNVLMGNFISPIDKLIDFIEKDAYFEGDIVICEVLEIPNPENSVYHKLEIIDLDSKKGWYTKEINLQKGMKVLLVLGERYSTREISGYIPENGVSNDAIIHLLNIGGITGIYEPNQFIQSTSFRLLGSLQKDDCEVNLKEIAFIKKSKQLNVLDTYVLLIVGSDMDVGKTITAEALMQEFESRGITRQYIKGTGAGRYRDLLRAQKDCNLGYIGWERHSFDFVDAGYPSSYTVTAQTMVEVNKGLVNYIAKLGHFKFTLVEIGGDVMTDNAQALLADAEFQKLFKSKRGLVIYVCDCIASVLAVDRLVSVFKLDRNFIIITGPVANRHKSQERVQKLVDVLTVPNVDRNALVHGEIIPWGKILVDEIMKRLNFINGA